MILVTVAALAAVGAIAAVVLGQGAGPAGSALRSPRTAPPSTGASGSVSAAGVAPISGVRCDPTEQITYHVHARLTIRVDGQAQTIPATIGQRQTCIYWLHTHSTEGVIHIEAPAPTTFTLGQFFDVWGQPLDATHVATTTAPAGSSVWAFVDGKP
jgi:hypothetical protein